MNRAGRGIEDLHAAAGGQNIVRGATSLANVIHRERGGGALHQALDCRPGDMRQRMQRE